MMRPLFAVLGALALLVGWLAAVVVQAQGDPAAITLALGDSAQRSHLPGLAARGYLLSAAIERRRLYASGVDRTSPAGQALIRHIIATRLAAARLLLQSGYVDAAESIALEGARADFDDLQARALLLEVRLRGDEPEAARREVMLMLLKRPHPQLLTLLGSSFARDGNSADAAACYERALQLAPAHLPALLAYAQLQADQRQPDAARALLAKAAAAATTAAERQTVADATARLSTGCTPAWAGLQAWCNLHAISLLLAAAYMLFLVSPALLALVTRQPDTPRKVTL